MKKSRLALILTAASWLAACAPLSQAGLVYAARGQAGVSVATGTPETPGLELNIGMKVSDFAYIPVVVGRPCEFTQRSDCNQQLIRVFGTHSARSESSDDGLQNPPPAAPAGQKAMAHSVASQSDPPPAPPPPAPAAAQAAAEERLVNALAKVLTQSDTQEDAYSVYGTFDSGGNASAPTGGGSGSAGLRMGRVFSTGVASQNLTQGQRDAQRAQSYAQCLHTANASTEGITPEADRNRLRQELLRGCAATQR